MGKSIKSIIREEVARDMMSEGMKFHVDKAIGVDESVYRPETPLFFSLFREARFLWQQNLYEHKSSFEKDLLESDLGNFGYFEGKLVPLDWPMLEAKSEPCWDGYEMIGMKDKNGKQVPNCVPKNESDEINEAEYKGRDVELNKPKRGSGGKAYVYVKNDKGNVIKVNFGSSMPDAMGDSEAHRKRRKQYGERHNCSDKKDKTKAGYWSCRATKFFGRDIPGWW